MRYNITLLASGNSMNVVSGEPFAFGLVLLSETVNLTCNSSLVHFVLSRELLLSSTSFLSLTTNFGFDSRCLRKWRGLIILCTYVCTWVSHQSPLITSPDLIVIRLLVSGRSPRSSLPSNKSLSYLGFLLRFF